MCEPVSTCASYAWEAMKKIFMKEIKKRIDKQIDIKVEESKQKMEELIR